MARGGPLANTASGPCTRARPAESPLNVLLVQSPLHAWPAGDPCMLARQQHLHSRPATRTCVSSPTLVQAVGSNDHKSRE